MFYLNLNLATTQSGYTRLLAKAVSKANKQIHNPELFKYIADKQVYDMSTLNGHDLAEKYEEFLVKTEIKVSVYYPRWRWSKALGYFSEATPTKINLNGYKLNRSIDDLLATFFHEACHMMDYFDKENSYGHGDNSPAGKENTFPYYVGNYFSPLDQEPIIYKKPFFKRVWNAIKRIF